MKDKDNNTFFESFEDESDLDIILNHPEQISDRVNLDVISDKVHVRIKKMAKDLIDEYAASNIKKELGGVLIGSYKQINDQYYIYIEAALKAKYTDASKSEIKFTHQTWEDIDRKKDQYYPNKKIVGWFHTHPGFGVFLSDYDLFIQENFFKFAFQVAYVVDPVKGIGVFFGNDDGEIVKINYEIEETAMPVYTPRSVVTGYSKKRGFKNLLSRILLLGSVAITVLLILLIVFPELSPGQETTSEKADSNEQQYNRDQEDSRSPGDDFRNDSEEVRSPEQETAESDFTPLEDSALKVMEKDIIINEYGKLREEYLSILKQQADKSQE